MLFQGHILNLRPDQWLPSRATRQETELASNLQTPSCPHSQPQFRAHSGCICSPGEGEAAADGAPDFLQRKLFLCHFQFHSGFWETPSAQSLDKTWNRIEMGSIPLLVFTAKPNGISSNVTLTSWLWIEVGSPWGTVGLCCWDLCLECACPWVSLDFQVPETIPDPFACDFTDSFLSCWFSDQWITS